jgi:hypothetical protein
MNRWFLSLLSTLTVVSLIGCSSSGPTYALVGVPGRTSYVASANILISDGHCTYVMYRGDGATPPEVVEPCALVADKKDALGNPHGEIQIGFNTTKGVQVLTLSEAGTNGEFAKSIPDIGVYLPDNWNIVTPEDSLLIKANAQGTVYANLLVSIGGVRCSLTVVPVATNTPVNMPCGLMSWSDNSVSISIPGALVSTAYTTSSWPLHFTLDSHTGNWNLVSPPAGFPATYTLSPNTATK